MYVATILVDSFLIEKLLFKAELNIFFESFKLNFWNDISRKLYPKLKPTPKLIAFNPLLYDLT